MNFLDETYPFALLPLPYAYNALEPVIGPKTMYYHHDKHLKSYVDNLNKTLLPYKKFHHFTLGDLLTKTYLLPKEIQTPVLHNGGGVYNHNLYFYSMHPYVSGTNILTSPEEAIVAYPGNLLDNSLLQRILQTFGSFEQFKENLTNTAVNQFGSGYGWLVLTKTKELCIISSSNQDTPLCFDATPLLLVDVWEHAYYLQYKNERKAYVKRWFSLIDWSIINERYLKALRNYSY